jgi:membrane protease YdiL (CAAX protease family)
MAAAGLISSLLSATGLFPAPPQAEVAGSTGCVEAIRLLLMPLLAYGEELMNLLTVSFIYRYLRLRGKYRLITSTACGALIFGLMHTFGQGAGAGIVIGVSHIPIILAALYTGNIWVSALAHLYSNVISYAKAYNSGLHLVIIAAVSIIPALWAVKETLRKAS